MKVENNVNVKTKNRLNLISVFLVILLAVSVLTYYSYSNPVVEYVPVVKDAGPLDPPAVIIENGSMVTGWTYIIDVADDGTCYARDGDTGEIVESNADDDYVIQQILNLNPESVLLSSCDFVWDSGIDIDSANDRLVFSGMGWSTRITYAGAGISGAVIDCSGGSDFGLTDVYIGNMYILGDDGGSAHGIRMQYFQRCKIENVKVEKAGGSGIYFNHANDNQVLNSYLYDNKVNGFYCNSAHELILSGDHSLYNTQSGYRFTDDGTINGLTMQVQLIGCSAENNGESYGNIYFDDGSGAMEDCIINGFTSDYGHVFLTDCEYMHVNSLELWNGRLRLINTDNSVIENVIVDGGMSYSALSCTDCDDTTITNCNFVTVSAVGPPDTNGISLVDCDSMIITNNRMTQTGTPRHYGIYLEDSDYNIVKGNWIYVFPTGIYLDGTSDYNKIQDNIIDSAVTTPFDDDGGNTVWDNNYYNDLRSELMLDFTSESNGSYIAHGLISTPDYVVVTLSTQGYAWYGSLNTTHIQVYFSTATASGSVYCEYKP